MTSSRSTSTWRRAAVATIALVAAFGLVATACGDDKNDSASSDKTTTTAASGEATGNFDVLVGALQKKLDAAKGDLCGMLTAVQSAGAQLPDPKTPDQVKQAITLTSTLYNELADDATADLAADAAVVRAAVTQLEAEAKAKGYSAESLTKSTAFDSEEFQASSGKLEQAATTKCGGGASTTTAAP